MIIFLISIIASVNLYNLPMVPNFGVLRMKVFLNASDPYFSRVDWLQVKFVYYWIRFLRDKGDTDKRIKEENEGVILSCS